MILAVLAGFGFAPCFDWAAVGLVILTLGLLEKPLKKGWIKVEEVPKRLTSASKRLAEDENMSLADAETLLFAREKEAEVLVDERAHFKPCKDVRA